MPWHEAGEIVRLIMENKFDENLRDLIENREQKVVYIEGDNKNETSSKDEAPVHAEMKIISKLYKKNSENKDQEIKYIGSNKKNCVHCRAVMEVFNEEGQYC